MDQASRGGGRKALRAAFPHTLPVLAGFLTLGLAYGVLMRTRGYGPLWSLLMSAIAFCGSMQFAAIPLLTAAFDPLQAFLLSLLVNARHLFYGLSMLEKYRGLGKARFPLIYTLCDETFSLVSTIPPPQDVSPKAFYLSISLLDYSYWQLGTLLGGLVGGLLPFDTTGLDFALTALFVVLFLDQVKPREARLSGGTGLACAAAALALFGPDKLVIAAMLLILPALLAEGRARKCI